MRTTRSNRSRNSGASRPGPVVAPVSSRSTVAGNWSKQRRPCSGGTMVDTSARARLAARRVVRGEHVARPLALFPFRHRRLAVRLWHEARVLDERVVMDIARTVREHLGGAHTPHE